MAVLRVLDKAMSVMDLPELGFLPDSLKTYQRLIQSPFGMILAAGPTGSGKTTTLYASINQLDSKERNIITIEDPVEYRFANINQMQVNPQANITFARGLRATMRLDPDVILVGEMRDLDTMRTAIMAAETGHLVFSTLHSRDAVSSIARMVGVFPAEEQAQIRQQLSASLRAVISQQLLPRADGKGRLLATEVLMVTSAVANLIRIDPIVTGVITDESHRAMYIRDDIADQALRLRNMSHGEHRVAAA